MYAYAWIYTHNVSNIYMSSRERERDQCVCVYIYTSIVHICNIHIYIYIYIYMCINLPRIHLYLGVSTFRPLNLRAIYHLLGSFSLVDMLRDDARFPRCSTRQSSGGLFLQNGGICHAFLKCVSAKLFQYNGCLKDVSENRGFYPPKSSILIGFSIIFTIHFGVPLDVSQKKSHEPPIKKSNSKHTSLMFYQFYLSNTNFQKNRQALVFNRNPYNGYINPYYWVDDHPLLYGNNGSLDPGII